MTAPHSAFPPSFDGNPWTYGLALFSLTLVSALSLAQLLSYAFEARRQRQIDAAIDNVVPRIPDPPGLTSLKSSRWIVIGFLLMAFLGATPDVFILFLWGEGGDALLERLYLWDRLWDGLLMIPFLWSLFLLNRVRQALPQQLMKAASVPIGRFRWALLKDQARIVAAALVIAVLMTFSKAYA